MPSKKVLWIKVWGIAAVQGSITLTWVIYNLYFPLLLIQFGFKKELALVILIIENVLESVIEPIFGGLSDRQQKLFGSKIPLIFSGIIFASVLFILFPCFIVFSSGQSLIKWLLPSLAIVWAAIMAIFRAPTMSLLGNYATKNTLPQAASILTFVGGIVGAFRFDAYGLITSLGAGFAFSLGSFSLLIAAFVLRKLNPIASSESLFNNQSSKTIKIPTLLLGSIVTTGIWISWSLRFIMPGVSEILKLQFGSGNGKFAMTIFLILLGLAAFPAGKIASKYNIFQTMKWGAIGTIVSLVLLILLPQALLPIGLLTLCFSFVLNGVIPLILNIVPATKSGLGTGLYFGGFGAGMAGFDLIFSQLKIVNLSINSANMIGAIACLIILCLSLFILEKQAAKSISNNL